MYNPELSSSRGPPKVREFHFYLLSRIWDNVIAIRSMWLTEINRKGATSVVNYLIDVNVNFDLKH